MDSLFKMSWTVKENILERKSIYSISFIQGVGVPTL